MVTPIDVSTAGSPGWWLDRLGLRLANERWELDRLWRYGIGDCDLPEGSSRCRQAYREFQAKARANLAELITDAVLDRMTVTGFRTGAEDDQNGDRKARDIFAANGLRVGSTDLHGLMLGMRRGYTIVGPPEKELGDLPLITVEDPRQVITEHDARIPRKVRAAAKFFTDTALGVHTAYLYLPGVVYVATKPAQSTNDEIPTDFGGGGWQWDDRRNGLSGMKLPAGFEDVVPVTRFQNRKGMAEFEPHMDLIDRINHAVLNRMVIVAIQAFRQRAVKSPEGIPDVDEDGNEIDYSTLFSPGADALWMLPEGWDIWESAQTDIQGILSAAKDDLQTLAAVSRTPLHYITPDAANGSAEGASLMREGLVFKTEDRIERAKEGWARTMSLAFRFAGDARRADLLQLEPMFAPAERYSLGERADAASKAGSGDNALPFRTIATDIWQFAPDKVDEMMTDRVGEALLRDALTPPPVAPAIEAPPVTSGDADQP